MGYARGDRLGAGVGVVKEAHAKYTKYDGYTHESSFSLRQVSHFLTTPERKINIP